MSSADPLQYYLALVDDCTRFSWIFLLPDHRLETIQALLEIWLKRVERASGKCVTVVHTDNATEVGRWKRGSEGNMALNLNSLSRTHLPRMVPQSGSIASFLKLHVACFSTLDSRRRIGNMLT